MTKKKERKFTLSAAASRSAAISLRLGDRPVYKNDSISLKTSAEISDISTRFNLLSSISCSNMARNTGERAAKADKLN